MSSSHNVPSVAGPSQSSASSPENSEQNVIPRPLVLESFYSPVNMFLANKYKDAIAAFMNEHPDHRKIPWQNLRFFIAPLWGKPDPVIYEMMGYLEYEVNPSRRRISLTREIRDERIAFARFCLEVWPKPEDWVRDKVMQFIFTGEVFVHANRWFKPWMTIHDCHSKVEWDLLAEKGHGWMLYASFANGVPGPVHLWPKRAGTHTVDRHINEVLPMFTQWIPGGKTNRVILQQSRTVGHFDWNIDTSRRLEEMGLRAVTWPRDSPDLDPMMDMWEWMNDYIRDNHGDLHLGGLGDLAKALSKCYKEIPEYILFASARSMPFKLQKVIENDGDVVRLSVDDYTRF